MDYPLTERHRHDEVRKVYVEQLARVWIEDPTETISASIDRKIESFIEEGLKHATETLSALWEIANRDGGVRAPAAIVWTVSLFRFYPRHVVILTSRHQNTQTTSPEHWSSVNTALIKSIRKGVFFDRKYWARHSRAGDVLKPVYFSSAIVGDKSQQLNKCVSKFGQGFAEVLTALSGETRQG